MNFLKVRQSLSHSKWIPILNKIEAKEMIRKNILLITLLIPIVVFTQELQHTVLNEIKEKTTNTHSDAVIIMQGDSLLYRYFNGEEKPMYIASAGKSLASLAIGKLLDLNLIDSLNQPVYTLYPEWKQGRKKNITIKMLLNHTSGLQNNPNASIELEPAPDYKVDNVVQLALSAELTDTPGTAVNYNNKAVALLGGIVKKASGLRFDHFFVEHFFKPMNIAQYDWIRDRSGNPTTHGAFIIKPSDFLKFGQLVLQKGMYNGQRIISEQYLNTALAPGQDVTPVWGLLWWRFPEYEKRIIDNELWDSWKTEGVKSAFLKKIKPLKGKLFNSKYEFYDALEQILGKDWNNVLNTELPGSLTSSKRIYSDTITAYYADGFRGNYLVVIPEHNIIAIRCADFDGFNYETDFFNDFVLLVSKLVK